MWAFKRVRFWLVWGLATPFVLLFLIGASVFSGQWRLIWVKFQLIHQSLYDKFVREKQAKFNFSDKIE